MSLTPVTTTAALHPPPDRGTLRLARSDATGNLNDDASSSAPEGSNGLFFGQGRIPLEIFIRIAQYVDSSVTLSQVCVAWRKAVVNAPSLWTRLDCVEVAQFESVERVRTVASRSKGALRSLDLVFNESGELALDIMPVVATLRQIVHEISARDGARGLQELTMDLSSYRYMDDLEPAYHSIVLIAHFLEFSAINIKRLIITTSLKRFPAGAPFFAAMPTLEQLTLTSLSEEPYADSRLPEFFSTAATIQETQITTSALHELTLSGTSLMDNTFPSFPNLKTIKLYDTQCDNLYGLLSKADQLQDLQLRAVKAQTPSKFMATPPGGVKDPPSTLSLVYLQRVHLCGHLTPFLWTAPNNNSSNFLIDALSLKHVSFGEGDRYDQDQADEEGMGNFHGLSGLTSETFSTFFRHTPSLVSLNLNGTSFESDVLLTSLRNASASLTRLTLGMAECVTDELLDRLHGLVPGLEYLDVNSRGDGIRVSLPALARLAMRLKKAYEVRVGGSKDEWELQIVTDEPYHADPATLSLRSDLRNLLLVLSSTQVTHLTTSLHLNDPPNALPYVTVRQEIINLSKTPTPVGVNNPTMKKPGGGQAAQRPAATDDLVNAAKLAMNKWQKRREEEWAKEWCESCEGLELCFEVDQDDEES